MDAWIWIVIAVAALLLAAVVWLGRDTKRTMDEKQAEALRSEPSPGEPELHESETDTGAAEAAARRTRVSGDQARAEADRLESDAAERRRTLAEEQRRMDDQLRESGSPGPEGHDPESSDPPGRGSA